MLNIGWLLTDMEALPLAIPARLISISNLDAIFLVASFNPYQEGGGVGAWLNGTPERRAAALKPRENSTNVWQHVVVMAVDRRIDVEEQSNSVTKSQRFIWRVIGESVKGALHERVGAPNQDAIDWWPRESGEGPIVVLAVADGHGSEGYFRSDRGAPFAVEAAITVLYEDFLQKLADPANLSVVKKHAGELPKVLERRWKERVDADLLSDPVDTRGLSSTLGEEIDETAKEDLDPHRFIAYGATLLAALVTDYFILYLQLGDGDILEVSPLGEVKRPIAKDERLIANETTSLCLPNARNHFRVELRRVLGIEADNMPAFILLSTDGYANSFRDEDGFKKAGVDYLKLIRSEGIDEVRRSLRSWLEETTRKGSGDDITVGIIERVEDLDEAPVN